MKASTELNNWLHKTYVYRGYEKEVTVTLDFWHELQDFIYSNAEFHLMNVQRIHGEGDFIYVFGVKVIKGDK